MENAKWKMINPTFRAQPASLAQGQGRQGDCPSNDRKSPVYCTIAPRAKEAYGGGSEEKMKEGIHPKYHKILVTCACGNQFETRSTKAEIRLEICSACHPFFTGKQKLIDTAGRIERFQKKYGRPSAEGAARPE